MSYQVVRHGDLVSTEAVAINAYDKHGEFPEEDKPCVEFFIH